MIKIYHVLLWKDHNPYIEGLYNLNPHFIPCGVWFSEGSGFSHNKVYTVQGGIIFHYIYVVVDEDTNATSFGIDTFISNKYKKEYTMQMTHIKGNTIDIKGGKMAGWWLEPFLKDNIWE